eukprot:TRINITY_DN19806_c0_g1_i1.p1 TRINITY_DN19806_c0_g1~~TRINITY_DN19806_c0_g1_i1.p1  ORF type:complete len:179 (+),score=25.38 TRINITY_DN19806_c0_g1_i1:29-538(+)
MEGVRNSFKRLTGQEQQQSKGWWDEMKDDINQSCSLTMQQRLWGFGICFTVGVLCTFLSTLALPAILIRPEKFAIPYTLGNLLALGSTAFIIGPCRQIRSMVKRTRILATIIYVVAMGMTLFCAIKIRKAPLVLICIFIQFCALIWYCLSYIPYARRFVRSCCESTLGV